MASEFRKTKRKHQKEKRTKTIERQGSKIKNRSQKDSCVMINLLVVVITAKTQKKISAGPRYRCY